MIVILERCESESLWGCFCNWIISIENCFYIGWFGVLMIFILLIVIFVFIIVFIVVFLVDIDGICEFVFGFFFYGNNIIFGVIIFIFVVIGLYFYLIWEVVFVDEWLYNGGFYELIVLYFLFGVVCYMGCEWEFSFCLGMCFWIVVVYLVFVVVVIVVFLIYLIG